MVKVKLLNNLLKVFKSKKTTNESLAGTRKLSSLSRIWRRISSHHSARTEGAVNTTKRSSRTSFLGRFLHRRKPAAADELPSSSPDERNMPSNSDNCHGPLSLSHEVNSIMTSSSHTIITRESLSVSDNDGYSAVWESCDEDVLPKQPPIFCEMADATSVAILANTIKGRIDKIDRLLDEMKQSHLSCTSIRVHCDLKNGATPTHPADYNWFYRIWMLAVCVTFILLLLL